jgi:hypothetical protein
MKLAEITFFDAFNNTLSRITGMKEAVWFLFR